MDSTTRRAAMDGIKARAQAAQQAAAIASAALADAQRDADTAAARAASTTAAVQVATQIAIAAQQQAHASIAGIVSRCLAAVFPDDPYGFDIRFVQRRGRTEAELVFTRQGQEVDPLSASGGGTVDVASFALRVASVCLRQPPGRRLMVLDEPFKWVSADYLPACRALLLTLAEELGIQFIIVTHIQALQIGTLVEL